MSFSFLNSYLSSQCYSFVKEPEYQAGILGSVSRDDVHPPLPSPVLRVLVVSHGSWIKALLEYFLVQTAFPRAVVSTIHTYYSGRRDWKCP